MTELLLPRELSDLSEIADEFHDLYESKDDGSAFELSAFARKQCESHEAALADADTKNRAELAAVAAERVRQDRTIERCVIDRELTGALRGKVKPQLIEACRALIAARTKVEVKIEGDQATAFTMIEGERIPLADVARDFLASDAGAPFRIPPAPTIGPTELALRGLLH